MLIEVLVSIVIIGVGLLGVASLHSQAVSRGGSGLHRAQAVALGYAMGDRIRANFTAEQAGAFNSLLPSTVLSDPGCISSNCTPAALAVSDYLEWKTEVASSLPSGVGVVCLTSAANADTGTITAPACDGTGNVIVVKVFWTEKGSQGTSTPFLFATPVRPY
jgi:type IV pilus assembly protein PilV